MSEPIIDEPLRRLPDPLVIAGNFANATASSTRAMPDPFLDAPAESDRDVHLREYVRIIYKRRWPALTAFLAVLGGTAIYTFTATPLYSARVQLLIEKESSNVVAF